MSSIGAIVRTEAPVEALAQDWVPVHLGARDELEAIIIVAGGVPMQRVHRFDFRPAGISLELEIGEEEPPRSITVSGVFGDAENELLRKICQRLSASFYDSEAGDFVF